MLHCELYYKNIKVFYTHVSKIVIALTTKTNSDLKSKMLLQPRKFKYKTLQKRRSFIKPNFSTMKYGNVALTILRPFRISAKKIFRLKLFLKRSARKSDITKRAFWVSVFPHLPLSRKPKGMRMGKGVGKLSTWFTQLRGGRNLAEFKNLRFGRAVYYSKQLRHKLPVPAVIQTKETRVLHLVGSRRTNPALSTFF